MNRDLAKEKLKKIRELAERGVGGEKEQARKTYEKLLKKYEIADEEVADEVKIRWFRFKTETEEKLLTHIFYAVTGDRQYYQPIAFTNRKKRTRSELHRSRGDRDRSSFLFLLRKAAGRTAAFHDCIRQ